MNIQYALNAINAATASQDAAKDQSWGGYVHKTTSGLSDADVTAGKYKLIFVQRDGDQFVFLVNGATWTYSGYIEHGSAGAKGTGTPEPATDLPLDSDLMKAFAGDNWILGSLTDFEEARSGAGEW